jgi:DNA-binding transcriptional LysR family regulator
MAVKKRTEPDWQDLRIFLALARLGSLSATARMLCLNHATIARRLQSLEATLGEKLVERRPTGYLLTAAGRRVLAAASDMDAAAQTLGRGEVDGSPRGLVRLNGPPALAQGFLISRLAEIPKAYPGLDIDLATDLRPVSLHRREADIAVRLDRPRDGDVIARPLVTIGYGFYGTAMVCERIAKGADPVFVGFDEVNASVPEAVWLAHHRPRARIAFRANNQFAQATAAQAGVGLALLPHYIGRQLTGLQACLLGSAPPPRDLWLLTRPQDRFEAPVRVVVEYLTQAFKDERALFEPYHAPH